jgi:hypothetical protein
MLLFNLLKIHPRKKQIHQVSALICTDICKSGDMSLKEKQTFFIRIISLEESRTRISKQKQANKKFVVEKLLRPWYSSMCAPWTSGGRCISVDKKINEKTKDPGFAPQQPRNLYKCFFCVKNSRGCQAHYEYIKLGAVTRG